MLEYEVNTLCDGFFDQWFIRFDALKLIYKQSI